MDQIWSFVRNEENRKVLGWVGGGLVVVVGALWAAYLHFSAPTPTNSNAPQPSVTASGCSAAVGGSVTGSSITAGNCLPDPPEKRPAKQ